MKPSLLKSNATTPTGSGGNVESQGWERRKGPSRGLVNIAAASCRPVTTRSIARSLFISEARAAIPPPRASPANPDWIVQSVKVPLPLLRQSAFDAADAAREKLNSPLGGTEKFVKREIYRSRSPSWSKSTKVSPSGTPLNTIPVDEVVLRNRPPPSLW